MPLPKPRRKIIGEGITLGGLVLLAAGCVHYEPKPLAPTDTAAAFESRTLDDPGLRALVATSAPDAVKEWPPPSWDLGLLTLAAWHYHAEMEVAQAKLAAAEAASVTAGARPNPTAGFTPTYNTNAAGGVSPWTLGFTLDVPIEMAGKRGYRVAQARYAANSARLNIANTAWLVRSRVRKSLLDLHATQLTEEILTRQQMAQNQTVELLEARRKAGQSSLTEVQLVRVAATQTTLQLNDAQKQRAQARVRLADALGLPESAVATLSLSFAQFDQLSVANEADALRREALLNRPDVLGALADYQTSESALQLEIAKQYPDIRLGPGYAWDQGANKYSLGVSVMLPIFNRNYGPIAEAEAHRREAAAAFTAAQTRAIGEVELAFAGYRESLRKLESADSLLRTQRQRMKSVQDMFAAGAVDRVELLQAQLELGTNEIARAQAFIEAQVALGELEDAIRRSLGATDTDGVPASLLNRKSG